VANTCARLLRLATFVVILPFTSGFLSEADATPIVIDFEGVVTPGNNSPCPITPYAEDGFTLTATPSNVCNNYILNNVSSFNGNGDTTSILGVCADCSTPATLLTLTSASSFSLNSIDIGGYANGQNPSGILFTGFFAGGGTITQLIDPVALFATYSFSGFSDLSSLQIQAGNDNQHFALDNIVLNSVPEPTSLLLLGSGGFGLLARFRRRKSQTSQVR
jgi:hypothetical protein